jgi:hypothetical protein
VKEGDLKTVGHTKEKEIMIRNYRLHIVTNQDAELSDEDRQILGLNLGTSIYVNNSIIKPEAFQFTTSVLSEGGAIILQHIKSPRDEKKKNTKLKVDEDAELE